MAKNVKKLKTSVLTTESVLALYEYCLFNDDNDTGEHVRAEGIQYTSGFHPVRIVESKNKILDLLHELPIQFQPIDSGGGGGWSFGGACHDKNGNHWTGEHQIMDLLVMLGVGAGVAQWLLAREMWGILPGGLPYFGVTE